MAWEPAKHGNASQIVTAIVAIIAVCGAFYQIRSIRLNTETTAAFNREAAARKLFQDQLKLDVDHPELADPNYDELKKRENGLAQYGSFLAHLLFTCEEILESMSDNSGWRENCESRIKNHVRLICAQMADADLATYSNQIQSMVHAMMRSAAAADVAECKQRKPV